jgi:hypothetical protein
MANAPNKASAQQIQAELQRREFAKQVLVNRLGRGVDIYFTDWKTQVETNDRMYRGEWTLDWPDGTTEQAKPIVMNLSQTATDDFGRLVMEVQPQIRCASKGDDAKKQKRAYKREAILQTYAAQNDIEEENHWLALDLAQTGIALEAITYDEPEEGEDNYPVFTRIDPRGAFPRFVNNKLVDLIVVQRMEKELVSPAFDIDLTDYFEGGELGKTKEVEVIDYYDANSFSRVIVLIYAAGNAGSVASKKTARATKDSPAALVSTWEHNMKKPCVTWARLKTADGAFRGFFDQLKGATLTQNRILNLIITGAEQIVYAPFFEWDIDNSNDPPGPKTVFHGRSKEAHMSRVNPGGANPEVFQVLEYLESQARAGANYPQSRQGEVSQSIASASFVNSTMGNLTTMIKSGQKEIGRLWQRRNRLALEVDKTFCTAGPKSLAIPSGSFSMYDPQSDIDSYDNMVIYGAGAGLDALNKKAAIANDVNLGIASKKTAREQTDYLQDEDGEAQQIAREKTEDAVLQRLLTDPTSGLAMVMHFAQLLQTGMDPLDAAATLASAAEDQQAQQLAAQQAASAGGGGAAGPPAPGTPVTPPVGMNTAEGGSVPPGSPEAPIRSAAIPQPSANRRMPSLESMVAAG